MCVTYSQKYYFKFDIHSCFLPIFLFSASIHNWNIIVSQKLVLNGMFFIDTLKFLMKLLFLSSTGLRIWDRHSDKWLWNTLAEINLVCLKMIQVFYSLLKAFYITSLILDIRLNLQNSYFLSRLLHNHQYWIMQL